MTVEEYLISIFDHIELFYYDHDGMESRISSVDQLRLLHCNSIYCYTEYTDKGKFFFHVRSIHLDNYIKQYESKNIGWILNYKRDKKINEFLTNDNT